MRIVTFVERPDLIDRLGFLDEVWPEYNKHGEVLNRYWGSLWTQFPEFQLVLYDEQNDAVFGEGTYHSLRLARHGRWFAGRD
jgi:hypothetical protein